ncbi:MAG: RidA family protein [Candidatus Helarchaeota archaeon]
MVKIESFDAGVPTAGPYSPCVRAGNIIYVSGQAGLPAEDVKGQTRGALENIKKLVEAAGGKVGNIVKITVFMKDIKTFNRMNLAYKKFFNENDVKIFPARTTIEVSNLPVGGMLVEIDAIAHIGD